MVESLARLVATVILLAAVATACGSARRGSAVATESVGATVAVQPAPGTVETGNASWYGRAHQGKATASGERFDMHALTAAHRTLPLGTWVLVTNLVNGRAVQVRINDRGPVMADRIIDLSYAAARALGAVGAGVFPVRVAVIE
jgi:rare lipoprotein A